MSKQVPLVVYLRGQRHEIGMAIVNDDGSIQAQVAKDHQAVAKVLLGGDGGEFSFAAPPADRPLAVDYTIVRTNADLPPVPEL